MHEISNLQNYEFALKYYNEVHHTTLDPEKEGVVRIHLVPPRYSRDDIEASIAIINGQDIVPVNVAWSILLTAFIEEVNKYSGHQVSDEDVNNIMDNTCKIVKKIYPFDALTEYKQRAMSPNNPKQDGTCESQDIFFEKGFFILLLR